MAEGAAYITQERLRRLDAARFQRLGDELLPSIDVRLTKIIPNGINQDDRTTTGVPDSFVGPDASSCVVGIEYTVKKERLLTKFTNDYNDVVKACKQVQLVVLVSAVTLDGEDFSLLRNKAREGGKELLLIGGEQLAEALDTKRQDLRFEFLNIPVNVLNVNGLREALFKASERAGHSLIPQGSSAALITHRDLRHNLNTRLTMERAADKSLPIIVVHGQVGVGKTIWCWSYACQRAKASATAWISALDVEWSKQDPIASQLCHYAYGIDAPERVVDLCVLLESQSEQLTIVLDGIDDVSNHLSLLRGLRSFAGSRLATSTVLVVTTKTEALRLFHDTFEKIGQRPAFVEMNEPTRWDIDAWLERCNVNPVDVRAMRSMLAPALQRRPLFIELQLSMLNMQRYSPDGFSRAVVDHFCKRISLVAKNKGTDLSKDEIEDMLSELALRRAHGTVHFKTLRKSCAGWKGGLLDVCISEGLLRKNQDDEVSFRHSYLSACFAAGALASLEPESQEARDLVHVHPSRLIDMVREASDPNAVLEIVHRYHPDAMLIAASGCAHRLSSELGERLIDGVKALLQSKFRSDVLGAINVLPQLPLNAARKVSVEWWNSLQDNEKSAYLFSAAILFLKLGVKEAWNVIKYHHHLCRFESIWIEPAFVDELSTLDEECLRAFAEAAWTDLTADGGRKDAALVMLFLLHDERGVEYIENKQSTDPSLSSFEHRLLIYANTQRSIQAYRKSCRAHLEELQRRNFESQTDGGLAVHSIWHTLVLVQSDIRYYPHDKLCDMLRENLVSDDPQWRTFGRRWLRYVTDSTLIPLCYYHSEGNEEFMGIDDVKPLILRTPLTQLTAFHETSNHATRRAIVRALGDAPGLEPTTFLLKCLRYDEDKDLRFYAIESLGRLGSAEAVTTLCGIMDEGDITMMDLAAQALGAIGHVSAIGALVRALDRTLASEAPEKNERDPACNICQALASFGESASALLLERWDSLRHKNVVMHAWTQLGCEALLLSVLAKEPRLIADVAVSLSFGEGFGLPRYQYNVRDNPRMFLSSEELYQMIHDYVDNPFVKDDYSLSILDPAQIYAAFDLDDAQEELKKLAHIEKTKKGASMATRILAARHTEPYRREEVEADIDTYLSHKSKFISTVDKYDSGYVREVLLQRINGKINADLIWLFSQFARDEDRAYFEKLETHDDLTIANIAHNFLRWM